MSRLVSILLLVAIALQASLGGARSAVAICFGDGHPAEAHRLAEDDAAFADTSSAVAGCVHDCSHGADAGLPVVLDTHGEACPCVDLELSLVDLLAASRTGLGAGDDEGALAPPSELDVDAMSAGPLALHQAWRGPPVERVPAPLAATARSGSVDRLMTGRLAAIRPVRLRL